MIKTGRDNHRIYREPLISVCSVRICAWLHMGADRRSIHGQKQNQSPTPGGRLLMATKKAKKLVYSPVASAIREAAAAGNPFAQYLIQSRDYFAKVNEQNRKERKVVSLQQTLIYTNHSKCRRKIERQLQELGEAK